MKIKIINVGNKLNKWESDGIGYYQKQLPKNIRISFINLKSQQNPNLSKKEILQKEGKQVLSKISRSDFVISWDSTGKQLDSYEFSNFILDSTQSKKEIFFIIGGSHGLSMEVLNRSNQVFSASLLTFPHRLFRLILMEQIYRAFSIMQNKPYHK